MEGITMKLRNLALGILCAAALTGAATTAHAADVKTAVPSNNTVFVDGKQIAPAAYKIGGSNYFKLRDLAYMINGTGKQFECGYDAANKTVALTTGAAYTAVGGEMTAPPAGNAEAEPSPMKLMKDGAPISMQGYLIHGNNYFKLRDVMGLFNVGTWYEQSSASVQIETALTPAEAAAKEQGKLQEVPPEVEPEVIEPDGAAFPDPWASPVGTSSAKWSEILAESGEVREIPFSFYITTGARENSGQPIPGCRVALYFMDKATQKPICLIGTYETGSDGYARTTLKLPAKYVEDSKGVNEGSPSWFGYELQKSIEIGGEPFYAVGFHFLQWNHFYLHEDAKIFDSMFDAFQYEQVKDAFKFGWMDI